MYLSLKMLLDSCLLVVGEEVSVALLFLILLF